MAGSKKALILLLTLILCNLQAFSAAKKKSENKGQNYFPESYALLEKKMQEEVSVITSAFLAENIFYKTNNSSFKDSIEKLKEVCDECIKLSDSALPSKEEEFYKTEFNLLKKLTLLTQELLKNIILINEKTTLTISKPEDIKLTLRSENDIYSKTLVSNAASLLDIRKNISSIRTSQAVSESYSLKNKSPYLTNLLQSIVSACSEIEKTTTNFSIKFWIESAKYYSQAALLIAEEDKKNTDKLLSYIDEKKEEKFAGKCISECKNAESIFESDKKILQNSIENLNEGYGFRTNFINEQKTIEESIKQIDDLKNSLNEISKKAEEKYFKAKIAVNTIETSYQKGISFYNKKDYLQSFNQQQKAMTLYTELESELKNDCDLRNQIYVKLSELKQNIIDAEKPLFVIEQRNFKINARKAYDSGNFENAAFIITQAEEKRSLWERMMDSELESDSELERLKDFVNTAIAIKEGREISRYDSKSPEILQNLYEAQKNFTQGEKLFNEGKKQEAESFLKTAEEKIQLVKNYYPRNREAGILRLKIDQLTDKKAFDASFPEKIEKLKKEVTSSNSSSRQAYSELLDLYEINPSYPQLKKIITEAEYTLGFRQRPADSSQIKKAAELSLQAEDALNQAKRDDILLEHARSLCNQALALNSDDSRAITVLDEIARRKGEKPAVILSSSDEDLYHKALKDYQSGNLADAKLKINTLLKNNNNARSAKIIKLKGLVERKLNE